MRCVVGAVAASLIASSASAAAPPAQLQPTDKWVVDFAEEQCAAMRTFSSGGDQIIVSLIPDPAGDEAQLWIVPNASVGSLERGAVSTGAVKTEGSLDWPIGVTAKGERVYRALLTAPEYSRLRSTGQLGIDGKAKNFELHFALPAKVDELLKACEADLLKTWGFGPELANLSAYAKPDRGRIAAFFRVSDYPESAVRREAMGAARVMITVGPDGRGKACRVLKSSGHQDLDDATCRVLTQRARYTPAKDEAGRAVAAPSVALIRWVLPD